MGLVHHRYVAPCHVLIMAVVFMCLSEFTRSADVSVKILSFNVRTSEAKDVCPCGCWEKRSGRIKRQISSINPDIFGTQETSLAQRASIDSTLADQYKSVGQFSQNYNENIGEVNAIYYKFNTWKLLDNSMVWLGPDPTKPSAAWGMKYYRSAVWARFQHLSSGITICVFNTHFETLGNDLAQTEGAKIISQQMKSKCNPQDRLSVLTGDLNATPSFPAITYLTGSNGNPFALQDSSNGEPTWCANMIDAKCSADKFDYVLYNKMGFAQTCPMKSEVIRQNIDNCYISDHALIATTFCLGGTCCGDTKAGIESTPAPTTQPSTESPNPSNTPEMTSATTTSPTKDSASSKPGSLSGGASDVSSSKSIGSVAGSKSSSTVSVPRADSEKPMTATTRSDNESSAGGTILSVFGVLIGSALVVVFGVLLYKKRQLQKKTSEMKSSGNLESSLCVLPLAVDLSSRGSSIPYRTSSELLQSEREKPRANFALL